jgi:hypothetical protein
MDTQSNQSEGPTNARVKKRRSPVLPILGVGTFVLVLAAILIPHQMVSRVARDEISAVESLRALTNLELRYATHPSQGFTCDFGLLKTEASSNGKQTHEGFLFSDSFEGYKFSLAGCEVDAKGVVVRYKATAVPLLPGQTGFRAFCTD